MSNLCNFAVGTVDFEFILHLVAFRVAGANISMFAFDEKLLRVRDVLAKSYYFSIVENLLNFV